MREIDFKKVAEQVKEINTIVSTCPDGVKEKCFELLFGLIFHDETQDPAASRDNLRTHEDKKDVNTDSRSRQYKLPSNVLALTHKYNISQADIEKLFLLDHEPLLPIYKVSKGNMAAAQIQKVMMVLLQNGLLNNQVKTSYEELRQSCKEDGLYDGNFNKVLKRNHQLFKGAITAGGITETESVELTGDGYEKLSEVVRELGQSTE